MRGLGILAAGAVLVALLTSGIAAAEKVTVGDIPFRSEFAFAPKALPKRTPAEASLGFETRLPTMTASAVPLPAARDITLRLDRNIVLDFKRYSRCTANLEGNDVPSIEALCGTAIVGGGSANFEAAAVGSQRPVDLITPTILVNGGRRGPVRILYLVAQVDPGRSPGVAMVVMPIRIRIVDDGRFAREVRISIPASSIESVGFLTSLQLKFARRFTQDREASAVSATCPDGKLMFSSAFEFTDGTHWEQDSVRPCTGTG